MYTITYKGYVGKYRLYNDDKDSKPYYAGKISSVKQHALVLFEGETMEELTEDFQAAVEDCISRGYKSTEMPHRITIPGVLYAQLTAQAKQNGKSVSSYISNALASLVL